MIPRLGINEKALPEGSIDSQLGHARTAGFDFYELAIDESTHRIERLGWTATDRRAVADAATRLNMPIEIVTLSAHRSIPLGSASPTTRRRARDLLTQAIQLAADLRSSIVQIAGYYVFYEPAHDGARSYFIEGLAAGCDVAADLGISLGLENVDGNDILSVDDALEVVREINHPSLGLHVDVGNLAANQLDVAAQLERAIPHLAAVDLKDTRPNVFRRVHFGDGSVPFRSVWQTLATAQFSGPVAVEMWNDNATNHIPAQNARCWLMDGCRLAVLGRDVGSDAR